MAFLPCGQLLNALGGALDALPGIGFASPHPGTLPRAFLSEKDTKVTLEASLTQELFMYLMWSCSGAEVESQLVPKLDKNNCVWSSWLDEDTQLPQSANSQPSLLLVHPCSNKQTFVWGVKGLKRMND